jgi:sulfur-oxidizing protein SoxZ
MIRISAPDTAFEGEVIELKAMIQHPMETGYRRDSKGEIIPTDIIKSFRCTYDGNVIFEAEFSRVSPPIRS